MIYCCEDCGFLFQRVGEVHACPSCEGIHFRTATEAEAEQLHAMLKSMEKHKEDDNPSQK